MFQIFYTFILYHFINVSKSSHHVLDSEIQMSMTLNLVTHSYKNVFIKKLLLFIGKYQKRFSFIAKNKKEEAEKNLHRINFKLSRNQSINLIDDSIFANVLLCLLLRFVFFSLQLGLKCFFEVYFSFSYISRIKKKVMSSNRFLKDIIRYI